VGGKTLLPQNPPVLNWGCRLTQVGLYGSHKTVMCVLTTFGWVTSLWKASSEILKVLFCKIWPDVK